jgi:hypothetical protein
MTHAVPDRLTKIVQEQLEKIRGESWAKDINDQFRFIGWVHEMRLAAIQPEGLTLAEHEACMRMGIGKERWEKLLLLEDTKEIRRALKATRRDPTKRLNGEEVYPKSGWLGAYLDYSMDSEVPLGWHFWTGVGIIGAALRRNLYIDRNTFYILPNHYMIMVGPTAAHKSTAIGHGLSILEHLNKQAWGRVQETWIDRRVIILPIKLTPEAMVDALKAGNKHYDEFPNPVHIPQSVGLLQCSELSVLMGKNVMGADRMIHLITDLYGHEGKEYKFRTRQRGEHMLTEPTISTLFGSTASWINKSVTSELFTGGFVGRNMWLERDTSTKWLPKPQPLDPVMKEGLAAMLLPWMLTTVKEMELTPAAEQWFDKWYLENKAASAPIPLMEGWKERKQGHLLKLAMVLAVSDMCDGGMKPGDLDRYPSIHLGMQYLEKALELVNLEEAQMPECFSRIGQHESVETTDELLSVLKGMELKQCPVRHSDLFKRMRHRVGDVGNFKKHMQSLIEAGEVEREECGRGWAYRTPRMVHQVAPDS